MLRLSATLLLTLAWVTVGAAAAEPAIAIPPAAQHPIDFTRDIWPLFTDRCASCHGEDDQQGQLRLDAKALVHRGGKSGPLFKAANSADSLLLKRLTGIGGKRMPLDDDPLTDEQIGLVRAWIDQGAKWPDGLGSAAIEIKKHWAYVSPQQLPPPTPRDATWTRNAIDAFVLTRLESESLAPSPSADRAQLIRRASLDLLGLPPSLDDLNELAPLPPSVRPSFPPSLHPSISPSAGKDGATERQREGGNSAHRPDWYDRYLDKLLASPRYGERWATAWLDAARYADSNGYQRDGHRTIWPYRDWVIRALNADLPFDRFTIEQIAGDLLPGSTLDQQIATGFHRCTTVSVEAGTDEEENRVNQVLDRVNVTGTVWLGTTLECCQCHDHKYDPFTQRDYYQLYAFFNNTPKETYQRAKGGAALEFGGPEVNLPADPKLTQQRQQIVAQKERLVAEIEQCISDEATGLSAWLKEMAQADAKEKAKLPANVRRILAVAANKRNKNQQTALRNHFINQHPSASSMQSEIAELNQKLESLAAPSSLVMVEMNESRSTAILQRGNFLSPGGSVQPATPAVLPALADTAPKNRLGLAHWLVAQDNPLTARVQANRAWAALFGRGIVPSEEDLGSQADAPSHPELLDWLAVEFQTHGWSQKRLHRRIVESATYQQSSKHRSDLAGRDPSNVLLARMSRQRLPAEMIRDNALAVAGRLSSKMLGPPVYPPQPEGIWRVTGLVDNTYRTSAGEDGWRRGLYTVQRRSAPYPSFLNFDAPDRSACVVKRPKSNTPLQALTLQNDPVYVEAAWSLADSIIEQSTGQPLEDQLRLAFRTVLSRSPSAAELSALQDVHQISHTRYASDPTALNHLLGDRNYKADPATAAAWFNIAQVLLNLDETITRN